MNILFIDNTLNNNEKKTYQLLYNNIGFYLKKIKDKPIYFLAINEKIIKQKILSIILKRKLSKSKNYIVVSRELEDNKNIKKIIDTNLKDYIYVSGQNNLYENDNRYIENYIKKKKIEISKIKILLIVDELENLQKRKFEQLLKKYKIVDIYATKKAKSIDEYVRKINMSLGTVAVNVDKIPKAYYNILLVFSKKYKISQNKSSFILDYNNSDLDIKSNTFLIFKKNKKYYIEIFNKLGMNLSRFEKTKLGKLYIHVSRLILDI